MSINAILGGENAIFSAYIYINKSFHSCFSQRSDNAPGKIMGDARSRVFVHNKLRNVKVTILILPLKQVPEMGQGVK